MPVPSPLAGTPVSFVGAFPDPAIPLEPPLPEVAVVGRSNVGKSSLLNALLGRRIARVSRTPGRTSQLTVYRLPSLYLLDLPGYGWARASRAERARYARLVRGVLERRSTLSGVLWLLDIRRDPSPDDLALVGLLGERGLPVLAALTKADKLTQRERGRRAAALGSQLALPADQLQVTSSRTGLGIADLARSLLAFAEEVARR